MNWDLVANIYGKAFFKGLHIKALPAGKIRAAAETEAAEIAMNRARGFAPPESTVSSKDGTRSRVQRFGRVGMMNVEILWMGNTNSGRRAKVRALGGTGGTGKVFWVDEDRVQVTSEDWKTKRAKSI